MNIHLDLYTLTLGVAVVILLFTGSILYVIREERNLRANSVLCLFLLLLAATLLNDVIGQNHAFDRLPFLSDYYSFCILCLGPLLYLYILYLTKPYFVLQPSYLWHFAILFPFALLEWLFWKEDGLAKLQAFFLLGYQDSWYGFLLESLPRVQIATYLLLCFYYIRQHNQVIRELMSSIEHATLTWLRSILLALVVLFAAWMLLKVAQLPNYILGAAAVLVSYYLSLKALGQKAIYVLPQPAQVMEILELEPSVRYSTSPLTSDDLKIMMQRVEAHMQETKPYLVNGLTLTQLADRLDLTPHQLSQALNEGFKENFYQFVNRYRVEESKRMLLDPTLRHYNILGVAFAAGFNSKSTFNKIFKEATGLSPSAFQKENNQT